MAVSIRLLDTATVGAQAARLVAALVCSVSVTTAVTAPMAYQAVEFRRTHTVTAAPADAPAATPERATRSENRPAAPPATTIPTTTSSPEPAGDGGLRGQAVNAVGPGAAASGGVTPTSGVGGAAASTSTVVATTLRPVTDLSEFNPHPSCDDKAQELNVGSRPACTTPTSTP